MMTEHERNTPAGPPGSGSGQSTLTLAGDALVALCALRDALKAAPSGQAAGSDPALGKALQALREEARGFLDETPEAGAASPSEQAPQMDLAAFARLLDMAGPEAAAELTERFRDDLHSTAIALKDAIAAMSWDNLRGATHILIALAGTAGADDLHRRALALNAQAKKKDAEAVHLQAPALLAQLQVLLAFFDAKANV
jgi:HPt (histidine-containing phosphotransfer) domain-containing protein